MRAYLPLLVDELASVDEAGSLPPRAAYGVTDALRRVDPAADEEDLEFEAMCEALDAARDRGRGRRVVAAADIAERVAEPDSAELARLAGTAAIPLSQVVSFHIEESEGEHGAGYDDLLWYDVTELTMLVN